MAHKQENVSEFEFVESYQIAKCRENLNLLHIQYFNQHSTYDS